MSEHKQRTLKWFTIDSDSVKFTGITKRTKHIEFEKQFLDQKIISEINSIIYNINLSILITEYYTELVSPYFGKQTIEQKCDCKNARQQCYPRMKYYHSNDWMYKDYSPEEREKCNPVCKCRCICKDWKFTYDWGTTYRLEYGINKSQHIYMRSVIDGSYPSKTRCNGILVDSKNLLSYKRNQVFFIDKLHFVSVYDCIIEFYHLNDTGEQLFTKVAVLEPSNQEHYKFTFNNGLIEVWPVIKRSRCPLFSVAICPFQYKCVICQSYSS